MTLDERGVTVQGPKGGVRSNKVSGVSELDMETMTDAFLTSSAVAAFASQSTGNDQSIFRGIANQRVKECNRIAAMVTELGKFGVRAWEVDDGIGIQGLPMDGWNIPAHGVHCYDDHRVAMSFSVLAAALQTDVGTGGKLAVEVSEVPLFNLNLQESFCKRRSA